MEQEKRYVVRKYVMAKSAAEAIKREKDAPVDDVWVEDEWKKSNKFGYKPVEGFKSKSK